MKKRILVVGYGTAGSTAAAYAKLQCRGCEVVAVEARSYPVYHPCSIPEAIAGGVGFERLREKQPLTAGVEVYTGRRVVNIDSSAKTAELDNGKLLNYDALILTPGSRPAVPSPLRELAGHARVFTVKNVEDGERIRQTAVRSRRAAVVGAGAIGLEVAMALRRLGLEVHVFELLDQVLPGVLDPDMAKSVEKALRQEGVQLHLSEPIVSARPSGEVLKVETEARGLEADLVVIAAGMRPDTELARLAGLKLGELGGVVVDERMETSVQGIYAAGDVVETTNLLTGKKVLSMFASTAFRQGRVAGINAGGGSATYKGTLTPWLIHLFTTNVGGVGLTERQAEESGYKPLSIRVQAMDKPAYVKGASRVVVKLVVDKETGRLLGAQFAGSTNLAKYIDVASALIQKGSLLGDLIDLETAYMPRFSEVYTPLFAAAEALQRKLTRLAARS